MGELCFCSWAVLRDHRRPQGYMLVQPHRDCDCMNGHQNGRSRYSSNTTAMPNANTAATTVATCGHHTSMHGGAQPGWAVYNPPTGIPGAKETSNMSRAAADRKDSSPRGKACEHLLHYSIRVHPSGHEPHSAPLHTADATRVQRQVLHCSHSDARVAMSRAGAESAASCQPVGSRGPGC